MRGLRPSRGPSTLRVERCAVHAAIHAAAGVRAGRRAFSSAGRDKTNARLIYVLVTDGPLILRDVSSTTPASLAESRRARLAGPFPIAVRVSL